MNEPDDEKAALEGIRLTTEFFKELKLPTSFAEGGVPVDRMDEIAEMASHEFGTDKIGTFKVLDKEDILKILDIAKDHY